MAVFILPTSSDKPRGIHRRLDIIFAAPEVYWTAIVLEVRRSGAKGRSEKGVAVQLSNECKKSRSLVGEPEKM
jgi:hypothetical protein